MSDRTDAVLIFLFFAIISVLLYVNEQKSIKANNAQNEANAAANQLGLMDIASNSDYITSGSYEMPAAMQTGTPIPQYTNTATGYAYQ